MRTIDNTATRTVKPSVDAIPSADEMPLAAAAVQRLATFRTSLRAILLSSIAGLTLFMRPAFADDLQQDLSGVSPPPATGNDGSGHKNGNPGDKGGNGSVIGVTSGITPVNELVILKSNGGKGGDGAVGQGPGGDWSNGGNGGKGGDGGAIDFTVTSNISGPQTNGQNLISLESNGGDGGLGGDYNGYRGRTGYPGDGGAGTSILFTQDAGNTITSVGAGSAVSLNIKGGNGLGGGQAITSWDSATGPSGGAGGAGGTATVVVSGAINSAATGVSILSQGGNAGDGADATGPFGASAGNGGLGGSGGAVTVTVNSTASISGQGAAKEATGGTFPIDENGTTTGKFSAFSSGILAQSLAGTGGQGGQASGGGATGGKGGNAGDGGAVTLTDNGGTVQMTGYNGVGILAQSVGGAAGSGNTAGAMFRARGGAGGDGGNGSTIDVNLSENSAGNSVVRTDGQFSDGIVAQSIGGGGGHGGSVEVAGTLSSIAIGGLGGDGGQAGRVQVFNGSNLTNTEGTTISTHGDNSAGILAQSISGGGGAGGDAFAAGLNVLTVAVGAAGGGGGTSGDVNVLNNGAIGAHGSYSFGIAAQSIAGGGGRGGTGEVITVSGNLAAQTSIGGGGGVGGTAGNAGVENYGTIMTGDDHAYGILAQSISGGGGAGGSASSHGFSITYPSVPSLNYSLTVGGAGNNGGTSGYVNVYNFGGVITTGDYAHGIVAQSIAGGGGAGGSAADYEVQVNSPSMEYTRNIGGGGGAGGSSSNVYVQNKGLIATLGEGANGIIAESLTGGGGIGGSSTSDTAYYRDGEYSLLNLTLNTGGKGGSAGDSTGTVQVDNSGSIWTRGDYSAGIRAQSIAGGGGDGGSANAKGSGTKFALNIGIGGSGGNGARGGDITINNTGAILTQGGSAPAIHAQTIGGGGGNGGGAAAGGGTSPETDAFNFVATAMGGDADKIKKTDGIYAMKSTYYGDINVYEKLKDLATSYDKVNPPAPKPPLPPEGPDLTFTLTVGAGHAGNGGNANSGGNATIDNSADLYTEGPLSTGILAQSIGAGGGFAGASTPSSLTSNASKDITYTAIIGGKNGANGDGGNVSVMNGGTINTQGDLSLGIFAQSIGGGGGVSSATIHPDGQTVDSNGNATTPQIWLGGGSNNSGNGGAVTVQVTPKDGNQIIETTGDDAVGIVAQSIGGGGGANFVMSLASTDGAASQTGQLADNLRFAVVVDGGGENLQQTQGNGGPVQVNLGYNSPCAGAGSCGWVETHGVDAYGVLAQSIGGGGGWAVGHNNIDNPLATYFSSGGYATGIGGAVNVTLDNNYAIYTTGLGSAGIVAQSFGGSGGLYGGLHNVDFNEGELPMDGGHGMGRWGEGGNVTVTLGGYSVIATSGDHAVGVLAQSLGGGAGILDQVDGSGFIFSSKNPVDQCGRPGLADCTGKVQVNVGTATIETAGQNSFGILAQSQGNGVNDVSVHVENNGIVHSSGVGSTAIAVAAAGSSTITIDKGGIVDAFGNSNVAVIGRGVNPNLDNAGTIRGDVQMIGTGNYVKNEAGGMIVPNSQIVVLGTLDNYGTIDLSQGAGPADGSPSTVRAVTFNNSGTLIPAKPSSGAALGASAAVDTVIDGNYVQSSTGRIVIEADHTGGVASHVTVTGTAELDGTLEVNPTRLSNTSLEVLSAAGGVTMDAGLKIPKSAAFSYEAQSLGNTLRIQPHADFTAGGTVTGQTLEAVAAHLQEIWNAGGDLGTGFAALASLKDIPTYQHDLKTLSGQTVGAISAARFASSQAFVGNLYSCPTFDDNSLHMSERDCTWARFTNNDAHQDSTADASGYRSEAQTLQFGAQKEIAKDWFFGVSGAYEISSFDGGEGTSSISGNAVLLGAVLKYQTGPWLLSTAVDGGYGWYDSDRRIDIGNAVSVASGKPTSEHGGIHGRVSYQIPFEHFYLKPILDLHATYLHADSYTEHGAAPFNLAVDSESGVTVSGAAMMEIGGKITLPKATLRPFASFGVGVMGDSGWAATAHFAEAGMPTAGFRASTPLPDRVGKVSVGADLYKSDNWELKLQYNGDFGDDYTSHTGVARLSYRF